MLPADPSRTRAGAWLDGEDIVVSSEATTILHKQPANRFVKIASVFYNLGTFSMAPAD